MAQLELDQMNALLEGKLSQEEHRNMVEAILSNREDAKAFQALHGLRTSFDAKASVKKPERVLSAFPKLRYAIGVAAVMLMAVAPFFYETQTNTQPPEPQQIAQYQPNQANSLMIAQQVRRVNFLEESKKWGSGVDTRHLIDLTNQ